MNWLIVAAIAFAYWRIMCNCGHKYIHEGNEPYIKCECGSTIDFEEL